LGVAAVSPGVAPGWRRAWPAPAKLNLFLHVVGRRADGYHLLQTAFRLIDLADSLSFAPREDDRIVLDTPLAGLADEENLVVRAARLLQREGGAQFGVDIMLDKRIPMGGGLGGGSSDAATTLAALNRLWDTGFSRAELQTLALGLGADVPFFLSGGNAWGEGVGERLTPLDLPPAWYAILIPPVSVPTAAIFAAPELTRNSKTVKISSFSAGLSGFPVGNDLESVVCQRYPQVARYLDWLRRRGDARMSGSGACVFAEFRTEGEARSVISGLPADMRGVVVRGLDRHPLETVLE
jgi:4-diphosphocytidyl-2-C-methyl-D-erythritol kinase